MLIRQARLEDALGIFKVEEDCFSIPWSLESVEEELKNPDRKLYFVVEEEHQIVAYAGAWLVADEGQITNIAVLRTKRREGYGAMLTKKLIKELFKAGMEEVFLEVRVSNIAALALYRRLGFTVKGLRKDYYNEPKEDAYIMSLIKEEEE